MRNLLDRLERRFGHLAIRGLMNYIIGLNAFVYLLMYMDRSGRFVEKLVLDPASVMQGEVWRLVTYIFIPPSASPIWIIFILYFYYMIGNALESEWGSFKFNMYYLIGMVGTTIVAFLIGGNGTGLYLNMSLFLAFAHIYPDYQLLIFFILPVKVKYLALLDWLYILVIVFTQPIPYNLVAAISIVNYFVFFGEDIVIRIKTGRQVSHNRKQFRNDLPQRTYIHKCTICGITEKDNPEMEFRYCVDCEGDYEYCMEHLKNHEHIRNHTEGEE